MQDARPCQEAIQVELALSRFFTHVPYLNFVICSLFPFWLWPCFVFPSVNCYLFSFLFFFLSHSLFSQQRGQGDTACHWQDGSFATAAIPRSSVEAIVLQVPASEWVSVFRLFLWTTPLDQVASFIVFFFLSSFHMLWVLFTSGSKPRVEKPRIEEPQVEKPRVEEPRIEEPEEPEMTVQQESADSQVQQDSADSQSAQEVEELDDLKEAELMECDEVEELSDIEASGEGAPEDVPEEDQGQETLR